MSYSPGDRVLIEARVQTHYHPDRDLAMQSVGVQLADGQHLITNPRNLRLIPAEEAIEEQQQEPLPKSAAVRRPKAKIKSAPFGTGL